MTTQWQVSRNTEHHDLRRALFLKESLALNSSRPFSVEIEKAKVEEGELYVDFNCRAGLLAQLSLKTAPQIEIADGASPRRQLPAEAADSATSISNPEATPDLETAIQ